MTIDTQAAGVSYFSSVLYFNTNSNRFIFAILSERVDRSLLPVKHRVYRRTIVDKVQAGFRK